MDTSQGNLLLDSDFLNRICPSISIVVLVLLCFCGCNKKAPIKGGSRHSPLSEMLNTSTVVRLSNEATISVVERPRPREVFYEGAFRALHLRKRADESYFLFPETSPPDKTEVDIYRLTPDIYLLKDTGTERQMEFILDLARDCLSLYIQHEQGQFIYPLGPALSSEHEALKPNEVAYLSVVELHFPGRDAGELRIRGQQLEPLPADFIGNPLLVGSMRERE